MDIKDLGGLGAYAPILEELYKDMAQPAVRNIGLALGAITSIGLFLHLLSSWGTDRLNICLKNNLDEYAERMKEVPPEDVSEVPPEIGIPIVEKLSYVTNEELRKLYIELLAKASIKQEHDKAHPSFINIINSLSPDEAVLLEFLKKNRDIRAKSYSRTGVVKSQIFQHLILKSGKYSIELQFPQNLAGYLENFEGLGIIYITESNAAQFKMFQDLETTLNRSIEKAKLNLQRISLTPFPLFNDHNQSLYVTNYGKLFLDAVLENEEL